MNFKQQTTFTVHFKPTWVAQENLTGGNWRLPSLHRQVITFSNQMLKNVNISFPAKGLNNTELLL